MPALALYHLARKACIKNIRSITDIGDIPYDLIRPILLKLENPEQLRELEKCSPQLRGVDAEIWREFIKRDIPKWEEKPHEPRNPENWYKVYRKLREESQKEVDKDAEILRAAMDGLKNERAKHTSKVVDPKTVPRLPRMGGMRVEGGRTRTTHTSIGNPAVLSFTSGSKTKTLTGKGVLEKARREARELSLFSARKSLLATPTHKLTGKASQVRTAPQGLLDDHKRPAMPMYADPNARPTTIVAPRRRSTVDNVKPPVGPSVQDREARLKSITSPSTTSTSSLTVPRTQNTSAIFPPPRSSDSTDPSPVYKAPRPKPPSQDGKGSRPPGKTKPPVDPFMPTKRRKLA